LIALVVVAILAVVIAGLQEITDRGFKMSITVAMGPDNF